MVSVNAPGGWIGSGPDAEIQLQDRTGTLAPLHARLEFTHGEARLSDPLGHPVYVSDENERLPTGVPRTLRDGERFRIGPFTCTLTGMAALPRPEPPSAGPATGTMSADPLLPNVAPPDVIDSLAAAIEKLTGAPGGNAMRLAEFARAVATPGPPSPRAAPDESALASLLSPAPGPAALPDDPEQTAAEAALAAFVHELGIDATSAPPGQLPEIMAELGAALREAADGIGRLLRDSPNDPWAGASPMKSGASGLRSLIAAPASASRPRVEAAVREAFALTAARQASQARAIRAGLERTLQALSPSSIERRLSPGIRTRIPLFRRSALWRHFQASEAALSETAAFAFHQEVSAGTMRGPSRDGSDTDQTGAASTRASFVRRG